VRVWRIEDGLIPVEAFLDAAVRFQLPRLLLCEPRQFLGDKVFRVPKLLCSAVGNPRQGAPAWRSPVSDENWFPDGQHAHLSVRIPRKELFRCGRPPQTAWSSGGQQQHHPGNVGIAVKRSRELAQIWIRKHGKRFLAGWRGGRTPEIHDSQEQDERYHRDKYCALLHLQNRSAITPAISCGKRIIPNTTTTAAHSSTLPSHLPRTPHCLARCCCQNPRASNRTERPKSHGRSVVKKALAAPAPRAAASPSGRQQLSVATELRIATKEAETPVPSFTVCPLAGLATLLGGSCPQREDQPVSIPDTNGNSARNSVFSGTLPRRLVR
jgi:hypothetical protein